MEIKHVQIITLENGDTVKVSLELVKPQFKVGDWVIGWFTRHSEYKDQAWEIGGITPKGYIIPKKNSGHNCETKNIRLATEEEIKAANVFPDGTPCLVRDYDSNMWRLNYSNGKGQWYANGRRTSEETVSWKYSMKLDINNLPVNE